MRLFSCCFPHVSNDDHDVPDNRNRQAASDVVAHQEQSVGATAVEHVSEHRTPQPTSVSSAPEAPEVDVVEPASVEPDSESDAAGPTPSAWTGLQNFISTLCSSTNSVEARLLVVTKDCQHYVVVAAHGKSLKCLPLFTVHSGASSAVLDAATLKHALWHDDLAADLQNDGLPFEYYEMGTDALCKSIIAFPLLVPRTHAPWGVLLLGSDQRAAYSASAVQRMLRLQCIQLAVSMQQEMLSCFQSACTYATYLHEVNSWRDFLLRLLSPELLANRHSAVCPGAFTCGLVLPQESDAVGTSSALLVVRRTLKRNSSRRATGQSVVELHCQSLDLQDSSTITMDLMRSAAGGGDKHCCLLEHELVQHADVVPLLVGLTEQPHPAVVAVAIEDSSTDQLGVPATNSSQMLGVLLVAVRDAYGSEANKFFSGPAQMLMSYISHRISGDLLPEYQMFQESPQHVLCDGLEQIATATGSVVPEMNGTYQRYTQSASTTSSTSANKPQPPPRAPQLPRLLNTQALMTAENPSTASPLASANLPGAADLARSSVGADVGSVVRESDLNRDVSPSLQHSLLASMDAGSARARKAKADARSGNTRSVRQTANTPTASNSGRVSMLDIDINQGPVALPMLVDQTPIDVFCEPAGTTQVLEILQKQRPWLAPYLHKPRPPVAQSSGPSSLFSAVMLESPTESEPLQRYWGTDVVASLPSAFEENREWLDRPQTVTTVDFDAPVWSQLPPANVTDGVHVLQSLGKGIFGEVHQGVLSGRKYAVKLIKGEVAAAVAGMMESYVEVMVALQQQAAQWPLVHLHHAGQGRKVVKSILPGEKDEAKKLLNLDVDESCLVMLYDYCDQGSLKTLLSNGSLLTSNVSFDAPLPRLTSMTAAALDDSLGRGSSQRRVQQRSTLSHAGLTNQRQERVPNMPLILHIALQIAQQVQFFHKRGVLHGDIKPTNILFCSSRTAPAGFVVKLGNVGFNLQLQSVLPNSSPTTRLNPGTITHAAPEVLTRCTSPNAPSPGVAADIYSIGILLWELHACRHAYSGEVPLLTLVYKVPAEHLRPAVPDWWDADYVRLMMQCWAADPGDRPSLDTIVDELTALVQVEASRNALRSRYTTYTDSNQAAAQEKTVLRPQEFPLSSSVQNGESYARTNMFNPTASTAAVAAIAPAQAGMLNGGSRTSWHTSGIGSMSARYTSAAGDALPHSIALLTDASARQAAVAAPPQYMPARDDGLVTLPTALQQLHHGGARAGMQGSMQPLATSDIDAPRLTRSLTGYSHNRTMH